MAQSDPAAARLAGLFPDLGPWTRAALWHGRVDLPVPSTPIEPELDRICRQKLVGLLLRYARAHEVRFGAETSRRLQGFSFAWSRLTAEVGPPAAEIVSRLTADQVPVVVSKGPGIAACYPWPEVRPYGDIDLLVPPQRFSPVVRRLEQLGWAEDVGSRQPWPYLVRHGREGLNLRRKPGGSLDLHHRVPPWIFSGGLPITELVARAEPVPVAGAELPCLPPADNLLVAALHLVSDRNKPGASLIVWRDLVELAAAAEPAEVRRRARATGLDGWLSAVLQALPGEVRPAQLIAVLGPTQPLPHPRRLAALLSGRFDRFGVLATQFLRLPLPNGLAFVAGMAVPSRKFLQDKYPDESHRYRRWWANSRDRLG